MQYTVMSGTTYQVNAANKDDALEIFNAWLEDDADLPADAVEELENDTVVLDGDAPTMPGRTDAVAVTLPAEIWAAVVECLDAYANDEDSRHDYPETTNALDAAGTAIVRAIQGGN